MSRDKLTRVSDVRTGKPILPSEPADTQTWIWRKPLPSPPLTPGWTGLSPRAFLGSTRTRDLSEWRARVVLTASDSVSHLKTSIIGNSITVPIRDGKLVLGTWQGIYLAEVSRKRCEWLGRVAIVSGQSSERSDRSERGASLNGHLVSPRPRQRYTSYLVDVVDSNVDACRCCPRTRSLSDSVGARIAVQ